MGYIFWREKNLQEEFKKASQDLEVLMKLANSDAVLHDLDDEEFMKFDNVLQTFIDKHKDASNELQVAVAELEEAQKSKNAFACLLYTSPSPRDRQKSRMPSSA